MLFLCVRHSCRVNAIEVNSQTPMTEQSPSVANGVPMPTRKPKNTMTWALLIGLGLAFATEALAARTIDPTAPMLAALGGMFGPSIRESHELFRLLTATLLHGGVLHLGMNSLALFYCGRILEALVGRAQLLVVFTFSALGGSLCSLLLNDANVVSVGASGAVMGVTAGALACATNVADSTERSAIRGYLGRSLLFNLVPFASMAQSGSKIDYAAHLGGAIAGGVLGVILAFVTRVATTTTTTTTGLGGAHLDPRWGKWLRNASVSGAALSIVAYGVAIAFAARQFPDAAEVARLTAESVLVSDQEIPKVAAHLTVEEWGRAKPRDPRVHLFRAEASLAQYDLTNAEVELQRALQERVIFRTFFDNGALESTIRARLARVLLEQGKEQDARAAAAPSCSSGAGGTIPDELSILGICAAATGPDLKSVAPNTLRLERCERFLQSENYRLAERACTVAEESARASGASTAAAASALARARTKNVPSTGDNSIP
jgi:rhomboid protease GluP